MSQQAYDKIWRECVSTLNEQLNVEGIDTAKESSEKQVQFFQLNQGLHV